MKWKKRKDGTIWGKTVESNRGKGWVPICLLRVETGKVTLHGLLTPLALKASAQRWGNKTEAYDESQRDSRILHPHINVLYTYA